MYDTKYYNDVGYIYYVFLSGLGLRGLFEVYYACYECIYLIRYKVKTEMLWNIIANLKYV